MQGAKTFAQPLTARQNDRFEEFMHQSKYSFCRAYGRM